MFRLILHSGHSVVPLRNCVTVFFPFLEIFLQIFTANTDRHSIVYHQFMRPFSAIYVRIYPKSWYSWISMRAEFYGCSGTLRLQNLRNKCNVVFTVWSSGRMRRYHKSFKTDWAANLKKPSLKIGDE